MGIPPRVEVLDEVQSQLEFERRWSRFLDRLLDDPDLEALLTRALLVGVSFRAGRSRSLRPVAEVYNENWDLLEHLATEPIELVPLDWGEVVRCAEAIVGLGDGCSEMIFGVAAMIENELRAKDVREIVFPHPTVSEIIQDTLWQLAE